MSLAIPIGIDDFRRLREDGPANVDYREYDSLNHRAYVDGHVPRILEFMRSFMGAGRTWRFALACLASRPPFWSGRWRARA